MLCRSPNEVRKPVNGRVLGRVLGLVLSLVKDCDATIGQLSTVWSIVWSSPQSQSGDTAYPYLWRLGPTIACMRRRSSAVTVLSGTLGIQTRVSATWISALGGNKCHWAEGVQDWIGNVSDVILVLVVTHHIPSYIYIYIYIFFLFY